MAKIKSKIPKKMQWLFWSVDVNDLDLKKDKNYIILQALNYGTWEDLKWLFKIYSEREIKNTVKNPGRGLWFRGVLNFWNLMFSLKLKKKTFEKAILNLEQYAK
ncbi:MAG: hypothetical protein COS47_00565 [Candidatus Nealsonbacteria bacterium CG03_land_8_20_14_0_80_36_12]|uniref:DUF6922 domain-containing protein n=1 Tax=Candidatus Nealsonbacteria bacterium CG03_land_8_20_14_0_80_36_12 TaxID=1974701 RepID=A0A2M7BYR8_9BACT|nr:MAG: hypothetical protein COS47_00565 [Candidatus Nealsonbacteria bacterium CG03_land_8_20_14_0_80_36_12]